MIDKPKPKRKKPHSNAQESLKHMRKIGYTCAVVERWNSHAHIRQDLFGGIDLLAIRFGETAGIQCSRSADLAAHRTKLLGEPRMRSWVEAGNKLLLHGWDLKGKDGTQKRWTLREEELRVGDFDAADAADPVRQTTKKESA